MLTPALLCHKDTAQTFLASRCVFMSYWRQHGKVQPMRAQYLEGSGPMRVEHSECDIAHLSQDRAGVSIECLHLEDVVVVIEAGVTQGPVRFPVSETRLAYYLSPLQLHMRYLLYPVGLFIARKVRNFLNDGFLLLPLIFFTIMLFLSILSLKAENSLSMGCLAIMNPRNFLCLFWRL